MYIYIYIYIYIYLYIYVYIHIYIYIYICAYYIHVWVCMRVHLCVCECVCVPHLRACVRVCSLSLYVYFSLSLFSSPACSEFPHYFFWVSIGWHVQRLKHMAPDRMCTWLGVCCCSVLQCLEACCIVLRRDAVCFSVLQGVYGLMCWAWCVGLDVLGCWHVVATLFGRRICLCIYWDVCIYIYICLNVHLCIYLHEYEYICKYM